MSRFAISLITVSFLLGCREEPSPSTSETETGEADAGADTSGGPCEVDDDCSLETLCVSGTCTTHEGRRAYRDAWREELVLPADQFERLIIGGTLVSDNFANQGDIEVRHVAGQAEIVVEMQRFTYARDLDAAEEAFERMHPWA